MVWLAAVLVAAVEAAPAAPDDDVWTRQNLGRPYLGQHSAVSIADLNGDGALDLIFSAGRHWVDQSFALVNLGPAAMEIGDGDNSNGKNASKQNTMIRFSDPLPLGHPGGYTHVDTAASSRSLSSSSSSSSSSSTTTKKQHTTAVLLAGGTCKTNQTGMFGNCTAEVDVTAATLLAVWVTNCSISRDTFDSSSSCHLHWTELWSEPYPMGDRNCAFAPDLGNDRDSTVPPAFVLTGKAGVTVFVPDRYGVFANASKNATYSVTIADEMPKQDVHRGSGLAVGRIGGKPGLVVGPRTTDDLAPLYYIAVVKQDDEEEERRQQKVKQDEDEERQQQKGDTAKEASAGWSSSSMLFSSSNDLFGPGDTYGGNESVALQPTGMALADLDGDGYDDLVVANYLPWEQEVEGTAGRYRIPQLKYYLLGDDGRVRNKTTLFESDTWAKSGRSVTTGQIFQDSTLPDIAHGTVDGKVVLFANLGVDNDSSGVFLGFEKRNVLDVGSTGCEIRDMDIVTLIPDTLSIVCAVTCGWENQTEIERSENYIFTTTTTKKKATRPPPSSNPPSGEQQKPIIIVDHDENNNDDNDDNNDDNDNDNAEGNTTTTNNNILVPSTTTMTTTMTGGAGDTPTKLWNNNGAMQVGALVVMTLVVVPSLAVMLYYGYYFYGASGRHHHHDAIKHDDDHHHDKKKNRGEENKYLSHTTTGDDERDLLQYGSDDNKMPMPVGFC